LHEIFHRVPHTNSSMEYSTRVRGREVHTQIQQQASPQTSHTNPTTNFTTNPHNNPPMNLVNMTMVRYTALFFTGFSHRSYGSTACETRCEQIQIPINTVYKESLIKSHKACKHMLEKNQGIFMTRLTQSRSCFQIIN